MVLGLVRRGLETQFMERLHNDMLALHPPATLQIPLTRRLRRAVDEGDGAAAAEAMYQLTVTIRKHVIGALEAAQGKDTTRTAGSVQ